MLFINNKQSLGVGETERLCVEQSQIQIEESDIISNSYLLDKYPQHARSPLIFNNPTDRTPPVLNRN